MTINMLLLFMTYMVDNLHLFENWEGSNLRRTFVFVQSSQQTGS